MVPTGMGDYGYVCAVTLARAHARCGDRVAIAAYLGKSDRFENAIADFAETCAEQNVRDHATLGEAIATGRVIAQTGI
jgi:sugar/nucleoside kinase (ribokinase family)